MLKKVKKVVSIMLSIFLVLSAMVTPGTLSVSALAADKTYYTERGVTERFTSATADDFAAKIAELKAAGYEEYSYNAIALNGKSTEAGANNLYAVYLSADKTELKHIAFHTNTKALHITTQTLNENDALAVAETQYDEVCEPLFVQIKTNEEGYSIGTSGMAYALRLRDGRFIMIDGGMEPVGSELQADILYNNLVEYNVLEEITIAAWVFTHAHSDHITAFTAFVNKYSEKVNIEQLVYNYPSDSDILQDPDMVEDKALQEGGIIYEQRKAIADKLPNVKISTPYAGDLYKFANAELEFYLTPTDMFPTMCYVGNEFNTSSLIFKIKTEGQEILITGDSSNYAIINIAVPRFGTALSSDMVQMVHHGITFGNSEMYELIGAETAFWPILSSRVTTVVNQEQNMGLINAPSTKEIILSALGTRAITLPYHPEEKDGLFVNPDGEVVDDTIYEKKEVAKYGDILDEDIMPWARSGKAADGNYYPLNNGGKLPSWGSISKNTATTNGSDKSIYFNANATVVYTPVYGLQANTLYTLSFDYMAESATAPSSGMFSKFGISGMNSESAAFSYNIYEGKSKTVNPNEVYGTANGWNHIEVTFTTPATTYDEYYLSFLESVGAVGSSYKGYIDNVVIAETPKTYYYHENDYEDLTDDAAWLGKGKNLSLLSTKADGEAINGTSFKATSEHSGYVGTALTDATTPPKTKARVSFKYKVTEGKKGWSGVGYIGLSGTPQTYNWANINKNSYTVKNVSIGDVTASTTVHNFIGTIEKKDETSGIMGIYWNNTPNTTIVFDDLKIAEIIDGVTATSSDEKGGTVTLKNKLGTKYTDFAVNETAIFTATANNGYYFDGWYDESGALVTRNEVFETVVTTDINLTAKFNAVENFVTLTFNSNGGSEVESISGGAGLKVNMPANPTKEGYIFAGWYLNENCTENYTCKVFPESDTTLYAKWINGVYQDFENFTTSSSNPYNSVITEDFTNSYSGSYFHKTTNNNGTVSRVVVAQKANEKLSAFAKPGDKITISFKYKLVSGAMDFYPNTSTKTNNSSALVSYTNAAGKTAYANGYEYLGTSLKTPSEEWQTYTHTYTLNSQSYFDNIGVDSEKALGYTLLFMTAKSDNTEFYVDDVMVYKTVDIPINYSNEAVRLEPVNAAKPLTAAIVGDTVEFKALCDSSVTPTVKYGDNVLTAKNGIYTITVTEDDAFTVTTEGITEAQNHVPNVGLNGEDLTTYNEEVFSNKIWQGDTIYHEAVMFTNSYDGVVQTTKKLLYPIDDIISVRNDNLNIWYVKGVDFDVVDGKLVWIEGGKCPIYTGALSAPADENDPYYDEALDYGGFKSASAHYLLEKGGDMGLYLTTDSKHEDDCVFVTYKHSKTWDELGEEGYTPETPENQSYDMDKFYEKLETTEDVNVLVYGASTATGCGATGRNMTYELFSKTRDENGQFTVTERTTAYIGKGAPTFFEQATSKLVNDYGNGNKINYYNIAAGGTGAKWGATNLADRVAGLNEYYGKTIVPDIVYIKFAGNDVGTTPQSYKESYTSMVEQFKALYPNAVIVLISGKINNERCYIFRDNHNNMFALENVLSEIADQYTDCVVAKTTSVWAEIVESKDYEDYLSNNINHANDFWAATTASIIVESTRKIEGSVALDTAYNNVAAMRSAEGSSTGKNGVRIYNEIKTDWIASRNIVEYGSVAINSNLLSGAELTLENGRKGVAFSDGTFSASKSVVWENKNGAVVFTAYLVNIPESAYGDDFAVRSYAIDSEGNVYYGDVTEFSVYDIANAIDNGNTADGTAPSETDANAFYAFVTDANAAEYKDWCTANGKQIGGLFTAKYNA